ncbi:MAG: GNAT family N-acetyltransferase [Bacteroidales bacterium]
MLKYGKIKFREWKRTDIEKLFLWLNDSEVMKYLENAFPAKSYESVVEYYEQRIKEPYRYMIIDQKSTEPIGTCRLFNINHEDDRCELSLIIGEKDYWGKGYGKDVIEMCKKVAFSGLNLNRLELHCYAINERAIKLYTKCGFRKDGLLREYSKLNSKYEDVYVMSILSAEHVTS